MSVISKISVQKQATDRYNIFFATGKGDEYAFSVDEAVLLKFQLKKGMEIDALLLSEIQYHDEIRKAYNHAVHYLSRMMKTEKEIRSYLKEKDYNEYSIQEVIVKLHDLKFLNDQEYAFSYVRTQMNASTKGPDLIKRELREKGVSATSIEEALQEFPLDLQIQTALKLATKISEKNNRDSARILKQKLEQSLVRKGFPFSIIQIVIEELASIESSNSDLDAIRYQGEKAQRKFSSYTGNAFEQKMKQFLYRKGFTIDLIQQFLEEQKGMD